MRKESRGRVWRVSLEAALPCDLLDLQLGVGRAKINWGRIPRQTADVSGSSRLFAANNVNGTIFVLVELLVEPLGDHRIVLNGLQGIAGLRRVKAHHHAQGVGSRIAGVNHPVETPRAIGALESHEAA